MAYSSFTLAEVRRRFGIATEEAGRLFPDILPAAVGDALAFVLADQVPLALKIGTEKAKSEWIVAPILAEGRRRAGGRVSLFSGVEFSVEPTAGLTGTADFLMSRSAEQFFVEAPVFVVVEGKRDSINDGLGQAAATMIAAARFNLQAGTPEPAIYGCVTTGGVWKFLRLTGDVLAIDADDYYISQPDRILGVLLHIVTPRPGAA